MSNFCDNEKYVIHYSLTQKKKQNRYKTSKQQKRLVKMCIITTYMSHKIFHNNLGAIPKSKLVLKLNKPAFIRMYISELSKELMYKSHYDYINMTTNQNYYSQSLTVQCMKLKQEMFMKIAAMIRKCLISETIRLSQNQIFEQINHWKNER